MKKFVVVLALVISVGALVGCSCNNPCNQPNQCDPCQPSVSAPVYQSPCCPAPSGAVDGPWGSAPAMGY